MTDHPKNSYRARYRIEVGDGYFVKSVMPTVLTTDKKESLECLPEIVDYLADTIATDQEIRIVRDYRQEVRSRTTPKEKKQAVVRHTVNLFLESTYEYCTAFADDIPY